MKQLTLGMILSASLVLPAMASEERAADIEDMQLIFKSDTRPVQLVALSPQEMKETEGAFLPLGALATGAAIGGGAYLLTSDNPSWGGFFIATGTGAFGFFAGGFTGGMIGALGGGLANLYDIEHAR